MSIDMVVLRRVQQGEPWAFSVWEPRKPMVVVGRGGTMEKEVHLELCHKDNIPVIRRRTGGGTVVLSPGMLVFSLAKKVEHPLAVREYTDKTNRLVIQFLEHQGVTGVSRQGLADLCIDDRKILGTGMYMGKDNLFYQASLLVNNDMSLVHRYLPHPPREPEYRGGRDHGNFITTLQKEGYPLTASQLVPVMIDFLRQHITTIR